MALPTISGEQIEDIFVTTFNTKLPEIWDNVYNSNPVLGILNAKSQIKLEGGKRIESPLIYGKLPGGSYNMDDTFSVQRTNTKTEFIVDWKLQYVDITIDGLDELKNAGAAAAFSYAQTKMDEAEMTLKDNLGTELFGSGLDNGGKALDGLNAWVDDGTNYATIGGITRDSSAVGTAAKAVYNATGGSWTYALAQAPYGAATIEGRKPDLIATTQTLWDRMAVVIQPLQRYNINPSANAKILGNIGFDTLKFGGGGADIVVDSHVQSGYAYYLHTPAVKMIVHNQRPGTKIRGWMPIVNQDRRTTQILWAGNVVVPSPRLQAKQVGLTA
jgi:hypothetical protein